MDGLVNRLIDHCWVQYGAVLSDRDARRIVEAVLKRRRVEHPLLSEIAAWLKSQVETCMVSKTMI